MRVLDLFSGIGGMSLGLQRAGMTTVAFCEIEPYCRRVLARHWPEVPIYDDVRSLTAARLAADGIVFDLIAGGFPCQDLSVAGKGAGLGGERSSLWFEYHRLIAEARPGWVLIENVPALRSRGLDVVLGGLAALGYDAEWHCIPAAAVGAPHRRDRVWIISHSYGRCGDFSSTVAEDGRALRAKGLVGFVRGGNGGEDISHAMRVGPQGGEPFGSAVAVRRRLADAGGARDVADAVCAEPSHRDAEPLWPGRTQVDAERRGGGSDVALAAGEGLPPSERETLLGTRWWEERRAIAERSGWSPEPAICRVANGVPSRVDRLKGLGNAVVPQVVELIGRAIMAAAGLQPPNQGNSDAR